MLEYVLWFISFVSLFVSLVWFSTFYLTKSDIDVQKKGNYFPKTSLVVPAYNEEEGIIKTIKSLLALNYPKDRLEIIVVDDGSKDRTYSLVSEFLKKNKNENIVLLTQKNSGKSVALNNGLRHATGELFGCVDADSTVSSDSLKKIVPHFLDETVGAVVSTIRVENTRNFLQKLQRFEYIFTSFFRKLFTSMDSLYVTPGVLSVYRRSVVLKLGGFDEHNITEDLEMGMRLHYNKYAVVLEIASKTHTDVPATIAAYWRQRIRWLRGHIYNTLKYKEMFLNPEYGFMGMFQLPLNMFTPVLMLMSAGIISYSFLDRLYWFLLRLSAAPASIFEIYLPTMRELVLGMKLPVLFPLFIIICVGVFLYNQAHKYLREKWTFPVVFIFFLTIYPVVVAYIWMTAIAEELFGVQKKW